jgi:hypothetical protein
MDKSEKEAKIKELKKEQTKCLRKLDRIVKAKKTESVRIVLNRAFKIIQIVIQIRMIQQEIITIASQSNIVFPNGGPVAVHKDDIV